MLNLLLTAVLATAPQAKPATNTICPVLGGKTDAKSSVVVVKNHAYRLCCPGCGPKLKADLDKYLEKDGTPKNAKTAAPAAHGGHGEHKH